MHQKATEAVQLELFTTTQGALHPAHDGRTVDERISRDELLSILSRQRTLTNNLLERIADYGNIIKASKRIVSNGGSSGVDGMETTELPQWLETNLSTLRTSLLEGSYQVSAVRRVEIPKPNGGKRMLGIPTVRDRLIQQAIHQELNRYYDPIFSTHSYGFRPGRSAHKAVLKASEYVKAGKEWVVDIDLEKFFDKINHNRLMQRLSKGIGDKKLLRLIRSYLTAGVMEGGLTTQRIAGTPQGGPLSPLLSNIVLDELDKELESRGHDFCRYADDCNIYVGSRKAGERVMQSVVAFIENKLKLKVNHKKSGVRHCSTVKFLGYTLLEGGRIRVSDQSFDRLKDTFRRITRRSRGVSFANIISDLNTTIRGWANYYRLANSWLTQFREIDSWLRRKLRCYRLKQCGRRYTVYKFLRGLGIKESSSWNVAKYSHGWWNMSKKEAVNRAMPNLWFSQQGLLSFCNIYEVTS